MRGWAPGIPVMAEAVLRFPEPARGLNGSCLVAPGVVLIADCFAGLIWRADLPADGGTATARVWLKHDSMAHDADGPMPDQPGINGVQYAARTNYLYYTTTAQELFMRVRVDADTHDPAGEPEFVAGGMMGDDFCLDENAGVAYIATHRQNTIDRVSLRPGDNSYVRHSVAWQALLPSADRSHQGRLGSGPRRIRPGRLLPGRRRNQVTATRSRRDSPAGDGAAGRVLGTADRPENQRRPRARFLATGRAASLARLWTSSLQPLRELVLFCAVDALSEECLCRGPAANPLVALFLNQAATT